MSKVLVTGALLALMVLTGACTKEEIVNNNTYITNTGGAEARTSALGFVSLYDEFGRGFRRNDGVRVTIKGTTPLIEAVTDTNGRYQFDSLRAGNYLFTYSRPGFGAYEQEFMIAAAGGNQPVLITQNGSYGPSMRQAVFQQSTTVASNLQVILNPNAVQDYDTAVVIKGLISPGTTTARPRSVGIAFDTLSYVTKDNFLIGYLASAYYGEVRGNTFRIAFTVRTLREYFVRYGLFRPGQRYYMRAYGSPASGPRGFMNRETGMYIWSSFNAQASNRGEFVVPN